MPLPWSNMSRDASSLNITGRMLSWLSSLTRAGGGAAIAGDFLQYQNGTGPLWAASAAGSSQLEITIIASTANLVLTNQANAEQFLGNTSRDIHKVDLTNYTQVRLLVRVGSGSASPNSPRVYAEYAPAFTTTLGDYLAIGASAVNCSIAATGLIDSGWINLVAGAKADVFITILQNGGNGSADPALGPIAVQFK